MALRDWDSEGTVPELRVLERQGGCAPQDGWVGWGTGHGSDLSGASVSLHLLGCLGLLGYGKKEHPVPLVLNDI